MRGFSLIVAIFAATSIVAFAESASAQDAMHACQTKFSGDSVAASACGDLARTKSIEVASPDSPAAAAINATTDETIHPTKPEEFAFGILRNVDENGNIQSGFAIDTAPYLLLHGGYLSLADYESNTSDRLLARTQLSVAVAKGEETQDESSRIGIGLSITPYLQLDPMSDAKNLRCISQSTYSAQQWVDEQMKGIPVPSRAKDGMEKVIEYKNKKDSLYKEWGEKTESGGLKACYSEFRKRAQNAGAWKLGVAPRWISKDGDFDDMDYNGLSFWSSAAIPFDISSMFKDIAGMSSKDAGDPSKLGQFVFGLRYETDESVADPLSAGNYYEQDSLIISSKLNFTGPQDRPGDTLQDIRFGAGLSYIHADRENRDNDTYYKWTAELKFRLPQVADNVWFVATAGRTSDREDGDETFVGTSFKWAFNDKTGN